MRPIQRSSFLRSALPLIIAGLAMSLSVGSCKMRCGGVSNEKLEKSLKKQLQKKLDPVKVKKVKCPDDISAKEGAITSCVAHLASGETLPIEVEWLDNSGGFSWQTKPRAGDLVKKLGELIAEGLSRKYDAKFAGVECAEVAPKKGVSFECMATIEGGSRLPVTVIWTDDEGAYEYADKGVVLLDKLEALLAEQLTAKKTPAKVDCHGKIRAAEPGSVFPCTFSFEDGRTETLQVTVDDWTGHVHWE